MPIHIYVKMAQYLYFPRSLRDWSAANEAVFCNLCDMENAWYCDLI